MSSDDFQAVSDFYKGEKEKRVERFWLYRLADILNFAKKYHDLEYNQMGSKSHHRIQNLRTGKFIDFWQTGTMRDMNGKFYGMGFRDSQIRREIKRLVGG